ncbi:MAG: hypothetical protein HOC95_03935 [Candidatus Diapherotrites archaeon]|jgi:hypothetical protein|nr:hypothetical protein [Candidatus Diapherotrites archaeon]
MRSKNSFIILAVMLVLFSTTTFSASLITDKISYSKGDTIIFTGSSTERVVNLFATANEKVVFERVVRTDVNNNFSLSYKTTPLDPSGEWIISIKDSPASTKLNVSPTKDSSVFVMVFASPIPGTYLRREDVEINVKVNYLGNAVEDAKVFVWTPAGKKLALLDKGNGIYSLPYQIPNETNLGEWNVFAVAQKDDNGILIGGENSINITIDSAPIKIIINNPVLKGIGVEEVIQVNIALEYFDGEAVVDATLVGRVGANAKELLFTKNADGSFLSTYTSDLADLGEIVFDFEATDSFGNMGTNQKSVIVGGQLSWFLKKTWYYFVIVIIVVLVILAKTKIAFKKSSGLSKLRKLKTGEEAKLEQTQKDYFELQAIDRKTFDKQSAEIESKIQNLGDKLTKASKKKK